MDRSAAAPDAPVLTVTGKSEQMRLVVATLLAASMRTRYGARQDRLRPVSTQHH